ncbi:hypothetical protein GCM10009544_10630 [Streptomyces stramineus]|uniref:Uncharacterized protein n=1 Tax=Streptomyces stramineus TaxID=173861 RepID=A0ABN0ZKJ6_9ACTN
MSAAFRGHQATRRGPGTVFLSECGPATAGGPETGTHEGNTMNDDGCGHDWVLWSGATRCRKCGATQQ